jgi:hypothetical protein
MLGKAGSARLSPVVGDRPEHQLRPRHERDYQLLASYGFNARLPQGMVLIEKDRNNVRIQKKDIHFTSGWQAGL